MEINVKVKVFERETKDKKKKFNAYKAVLPNGAFMDLKFQQVVTNLPKEDSILVIEDTAINEDDNRLYPCLWVSAVKEIKPWTQEKKPDEKIKALFATQANAMTDVTGKPLPF